ncbi:MAG: hypothetical protein ABJF86_08765 [Tateyamaria sp.]|uniref:hypothetical protein n=1 Tax=Tateyamaria sp. TaxID=1929288 RepID=UPI0032684D62
MTRERPFLLARRAGTFDWMDRIADGVGVEPFENAGAVMYMSKVKMAERSRRFAKVSL